MIFRIILDMIAAVCLAYPVGVSMGWHEYLIGTFAAGIFAMIFGGHDAKVVQSRKRDRLGRYVRCNCSASVPRD